MGNDKSEEVEEIIIDVARIRKNAGKRFDEIKSKQCHNSTAKESLNCGIGRELFTKERKNTKDKKETEDKEQKEDKEE